MHWCVNLALSYAHQENCVEIIYNSAKTRKTRSHLYSARLSTMATATILVLCKRCNLIKNHVREQLFIDIDTAKVISRSVIRWHGLCFRLSKVQLNSTHVYIIGPIPHMIFDIFCQNYHTGISNQCYEIRCKMQPKCHSFEMIPFALTHIFIVLCQKSLLNGLLQFTVNEDAAHFSIHT